MDEEIGVNHTLQEQEADPDDAQPNLDVNHVREEDRDEGQVSVIEKLLAGIEVVAASNVNAQKQPLYEHSRQVYNSPLLHFKAVVNIFATEHGGVLNGSTITTTMVVDLLSLLVVDGNEVFPNEILGQFILGINLENLRMKKKRPRSRKKEKRMIRIEKVGIG